MSQISTVRPQIPIITGRISALYQMGIINKEAKNDMAELTTRALQDGNFDALYAYLTTLQISNPASELDEFKDLLLFGD